MSFLFNKEIALKQAENYLRNNKLSEAINEYKKIVDNTQDLNIMNLLGDLHIRIGDNKKAIEYFSPVADSYVKEGFTVKAIAMYKKIYKLDIYNIELTLTLARLYTNQKYFVEARQLYEQVLGVYRKNGNKQELIKTLKELIGIDSDNVVRKLELANLYKEEGATLDFQDYSIQASRDLLKQGKSKEGLKILEELFSQTPDSKLVIINLANYLVQVNQVEKGLEILKKAIEKEPNSADLLVVLGKMYLKLGSLDQAEKTFTSLFSISNSYYEYVIEVAKVFLANKEFKRVVGLLELVTNIVLERKQKRKLTTILKEILKQDPNHLKAIKCLVYIYQTTGETSDLISVLKLVVKVAQENNEQKEAIEALKLLMELEPSNGSYKGTLQSIKVEHIEKTTQTNKLINVSNKSFTMKEEKRIINSGNNQTKEFIEEMIQKNGSYLDAQIQLLEDMLINNPDHIEARIKLKNVYLQKELKEKAAIQCLEISQIYSSKKELERANKFLQEAIIGYPNIKETEIFALTNEQIKKNEIHLQAKNKMGSRLKDDKISGFHIVETTHTSPKTHQVLDVISKEQGKEVTEKNKRGLSTEIDLSSIFFKHSADKSIDIGGSFELLQTSEIAWLTEANQLLDREWRRCMRNGQEISMIIIKIDNNEEIPLGSKEKSLETCTREVLDIIESTVHRGGDIVLTSKRKNILLLFLPETPSEGAVVVARRLQKAIQKTKLTTISQAIATAKPRRNNKPIILIKKAVDCFSTLSGFNQLLIDSE